MEAQNGSNVHTAFTVLVLGGDDFTDEDALRRALDTLHRRHNNLTILTGARPTGCDKMAEDWARANGRPFISDPRGADFLVCYLPSGAVCFPGGNPSAAETASIKVWRPAL